MQINSALLASNKVGKMTKDTRAFNNDSGRK